MVTLLENWLIKLVPCSACKYNHGESSLQVTASLTTFPARIKGVEFAIKSIMLQTIQPDRVILWLAISQFPDEQVPTNLKKLHNLGLEIRFCDDLRPHKKYYYALQQQIQKEVVITFDDDIIYHPHTIERLIAKHKQYPDAIICSQAHILTLDGEGNISEYRHWKEVGDNDGVPSRFKTALTGSGCLYPYNIMLPVTFDKEKLSALALNVDDLWMSITSKVNKVKICTVDKVARLFSTVQSSQAFHLGEMNCIKSGNDSAMKRLIAEFPEVLDYLTHKD